MLEGGLRDRMIDMSIFRYVQDGLTALGWFNASTLRAPVVMRDTPVGDGEKIEPNLVCMSNENMMVEDLETGSTGSWNRFDVYFDVYAESDALGKHLIGDIQGILAGQHSDIGCVSPFIQVYDYSQATPSEEFLIEVENTERNRNRSHAVDTTHARHMWTLLAEIEDSRVGSTL